ncbi:molecular chaperone HscC [Paenibacillus odorifer]|uniref:molecular chaperone HscC n=1 Tax=Paenibacillus TaxID=44249 RepID=UPI00096E8B2D|nr:MULTISPECIES: molecular chaperone HscC [Paenibacillus]MDH6427878.1 molecular chaperone HscC [Paenibacillus sp. PastH-4]MDH6444494.1 molecular chaperone HscC [Paenibacillus sp. PastF-4]MDH6528393.1 molecular chaperone HscC [Paenibacillus sp. PastH-3]OMD68004.1 molecular chaperone HscC [Paenibacillus odorifer]OMD97017.1 molecular chaperone HscC [Paenibacillus odorifer]
MRTIGIDLGTTYSLAAYWDGSQAVIIPNVLGEHVTPSIVSVDAGGEVLVGRIAQERLITHPQLTASTFKRFMGSAKKYTLGTMTFTPEELSSFVLRSLKEDAENHLGESVTKAIISVPAYFNDVQRKATKKAAEMAGLQVERLISEPTAAALAYGLHQNQETSFLVFDLGGGTFDVSILELFEGVMDVKSIAGDNYLGGEDFTEILVAYFIQKNKLDAESLTPITRSMLYKQAEQSKRILGTESAATMRIVIKEEEYVLTIERSELEQLVQPLLIRLRQPIERALRDASLQPSDLDGIVMIGGATKMPLIKQIISRMFGKMPYANISPDETVALGAAVQVALKQRDQALDEMILTDVCPYTLGTSVLRRGSSGQTSSGHYFPIIERNTPIPVSRVERLYTAADNQKIISVDVYQGESPRVENNLFLGEMEFQIPQAPRGEESIDVRYTYDVNGILEVEVTTVSTGQKHQMIIEQNAGAMTKKQIEARLLELRSIKIHPRERTENRLLLARGERLYEEVLGDQRKFIAQCLKVFEDALYTQNEKVIEKAAQAFNEQLAEIEGWSYFT